MLLLHGKRGGQPPMSGLLAFSRFAPLTLIAAAEQHEYYITANRGGCPCSY